MARIFLRCTATALAFALAGCSGAYSGTPAQAGGGGGGACTEAASAAPEHFTRQVEPALGFCRNCHVPNGVGDVPDGEEFMLSEDGSGDFAALRESWELLGGNPSRILAMASGGETHSGGAPWPQGSAPYQSMAALLQCFGDPAGCAAALANACGGTPLEELPLLGSKHAQHLWAQICEGVPDDTPLPADPRSRVLAGVNPDRAVYFNAYWEDCHVLQTRADEINQRPATCGEFRAKVAAGQDFLLNQLPIGAVAPAAFRNTWSKWGSEAPASETEFERMYTLRYGWNPAPFDNPYEPAPGSHGQLPLGMRADPETGAVKSGACFQCHGGRIGDPADPEESQVMTLAHLGMGNNNYDVVMAGQDGSPFAQVPAVGELLPPLDPTVLFNLGVRQRGHNNAVGAFEVLITLLDFDNLGLNPNPLKTTTPALVDPAPAAGVADVAHPLAHPQDTPAWWNMGSRPRKFFDAGVSNDSTRIIMAAGPDEFESLFTADGAPYRERIEKWDQVLATYFLSLRSPAWPEAVLGEIDEALAQRGAILFHSKNLWAENLENPNPRPLGGNGSCASCHGAYSPRYVNDPAYLEDPAFEGIAAHIAPLEVIATDAARSDMLSDTLRALWDTTYWAYPEGQPGYVDPAAKDPLTEMADDMAPDATNGACGWEKGIIGYQAPPLYGVWATAPYFHNGAVPTLAQVLDSSSRPAIWQRQTQTIKGVTGFDQRLGAAFDAAAVGWKHAALSCSDMPGTELLNCNPASPDDPSLAQLVTNFLNATVSWTAFAPLDDPAADAIDKRLVFDTRILGHGKGGHSFSDVLTDPEREAIIEYLKTL